MRQQSWSIARAQKAKQDYHIPIYASSGSCIKEKLSQKGGDVHDGTEVELKAASILLDNLTPSTETNTGDL